MNRGARCLMQRNVESLNRWIDWEGTLNNFIIRKLFLFIDCLHHVICYSHSHGVVFAWHIYFRVFVYFHIYAPIIYAVPSKDPEIVYEQNLAAVPAVSGGLFRPVKRYG